MSAWDKIESSKQEELKRSILAQTEDLVEDAADEIDEDTIEDVGDELWDTYICDGIEAEIVALGYPTDYSDESDFAQIWDVLNEYYWQVYHQEVEKLFE